MRFNQVPSIMTFDEWLLDKNLDLNIFDNLIINNLKAPRFSSNSFYPWRIYFDRAVDWILILFDMRHSWKKCLQIVE